MTKSKTYTVSVARAVEIHDKVAAAVIAMIQNKVPVLDQHIADKGNSFIMKDGTVDLAEFLEAVNDPVHAQVDRTTDEVLDSILTNEERAAVFSNGTVDRGEDGPGDLEDLLEMLTGEKSPATEDDVL